MEADYPPTSARVFDFENGVNDLAGTTDVSAEATYWDADNPYYYGQEAISNNGNWDFSSDFRYDQSWDTSSGFFRGDGDEYEFVENKGVNIPPNWRDGQAVFDLQNLRLPETVTNSSFETTIKDEFISTTDNDNDIVQIRQKYLVPKIVSNAEKVIIVFTANYGNGWKLYVSEAVRPDGSWSVPQRLINDYNSTYQLGHSVAISETDLYVVWQERFHENATSESEWTVKYGRFDLDTLTMPPELPTASEKHSWTFTPSTPSAILKQILIRKLAK